ncbi:oxygen-insensitive NADPH nitroreductase [Zobellella taiwanensis]|jgi:nitroreductase|uniref:Oxygen-insensitive NADPH nitroreductase n=1 Tax=Zobellella taiwanensis TaxID=347535 RepID=A0A2P7QHR2_9GAMM|nr:oxygen-insensitive NADPH nitroreductase [Zobellella taiwanensis]PSJ37456.1 oxygen-insensitive NADPH nitroreductase [Zobellella taiwanensis]
MTPAIEVMRGHRSIRKFTGQPLTESQLEAIMASAQAASSSSFLQASAVIRVTDPGIRAQVMNLCANQAYVGSAAEFWVFCADFHRHLHWVPEARTGFAEQLLIGAIDTALMGQNALTAAESLGLGGVFIGAVRNHPYQLSELLELPAGVIPLFGLCLGHPDQDPEPKPRLPKALMFSENRYPNEPETELMTEYDRQVRHYYQTRTGGNKDMTWTGQIADILAREARPFMLEFLRSQGYCLR